MSAVEVWGRPEGAVPPPQNIDLFNFGPGNGAFQAIKYLMI